MQCLNTENKTFQKTIKEVINKWKEMLRLTHTTQVRSTLQFPDDSVGLDSRKATVLVPCEAKGDGSQKHCYYGKSLVQSFLLKDLAYSTSVDTALSVEHSGGMQMKLRKQGKFHNVT